MASNTTDARRVHWEKTRNVTIVVLVIWAFFAIFIHLFASSLNNTTFVGFPLGYYMAAQGSLIVFVVLIAVHNWLQDKIDDEAGVGDE